MICNLVESAVTEIVVVEVKDIAQRLRAINVKTHASSIHSHRVEKAEQAEQMVSMDVTYEYGLDLQERQMVEAHGLLSPFAAINKIPTTIYHDYLATTMTPQSGQSSPTS